MNMTSRFIYTPLAVLCAPFIGSFTLFAFITSFLAIFVILIRLGLLAVEFLGGFILDFIKHSINKISLGENPESNNHMNSNDIKDTFNKPKRHRHHLPTKSPRTSLLLESTKSAKFYDPAYGKNFVSNDDYFMMFAKKRPSGRRARTDYVL